MSGGGSSAAVARRWCAEVAGDLLDLVLPAACAGCGGPAGGRPLCPACAAVLAAGVAAEVCPTPAPAGFPRCAALGGYDGVLREALLQYKERGRHPLGAVLGERLAAAVRVAAPGRLPVLLVPVPGTAAAVRKRHGDHMVRLARIASQVLRTAGVPAAVGYPLRARPRPDSTGLTSAERGVVATASFVCRPRRLGPIRAATSAGIRLVVLDDVVTTGATLAAVTTLLAASGVPVSGAAVLAATRRHRPYAG
jgi:predicted amidophosphoribosyltransferase